MCVCPPLLLACFHWRKLSPFVCSCLILPGEFPAENVCTRVSSSLEPPAHSFLSLRQANEWVPVSSNSLPFSSLRSLVIESPLQHRRKQLCVYQECVSFYPPPPASSLGPTNHHHLSISRLFSNVLSTSSSLSSHCAFFDHVKDSLLSLLHTHPCRPFVSLSCNIHM